MNEQYWIYILRCANNTLYTGYTNNLKKRYESHVNGTGRCKYTLSFKPLCIAQSWQLIGTKADAMRLERQIKKLSRIEKEKLISHPELLSENANIQPYSLFK